METITINDTEYNIADLEPGTVELINRVAVLRGRISEAQQTINELNILVDAYGSAIVESLPSKEEGDK
jgi:predicted S18 family serine protease